MALSDILARLRFADTSAGDEAKIRGVITAAYNGSSSAELLLNKLLAFAEGTTLKFINNYGQGSKADLGGLTVYYDFEQTITDVYITTELGSKNHQT